eukprot:5691708-Amphidinium_carterae.1
MTRERPLHCWDVTRSLPPMLLVKELHSRYFCLQHTLQTLVSRRRQSRFPLPLTMLWRRSCGVPDSKLTPIKLSHSVSMTTER